MSNKTNANASTPPAQQKGTSNILWGGVTLGLLGCIVLVILTIQNQLTLSSLQQELDLLSGQQNQQQTKIEKNLDTQRQLQEKLTALSTQITLPAHNQTSSNWGQVRDCLQLSYTNLVFFQDQTQAITWLTNAYNLVKTFSDPNNAGISEQIRKLLQTVQQLPIPNKTAIFQNLNTLKTEILSLEKDNLTAKQVPQESTPSDPATWQDWLSTQYWHAHLHDAFARITETILSSISIQEIESMDSIQISANTLRNLHLTSRALIEQAQWGLLHNNDVVFHDALKQLQEGIEKTAPQSPQRETILQAIQKLLATSIQVSYPNYTATIERINQEIAQATQKSPTNTTPEPAQKAPEESNHPSTANSTTQETSSSTPSLTIT